MAKSSRAKRNTLFEDLDGLNTTPAGVAGACVAEPTTAKPLEEFNAPAVTVEALDEVICTAAVGICVLGVLDPPPPQPAISKAMLEDARINNDKFFTAVTSINDELGKSEEASEANPIPKSFKLYRSAGLSV